jgi:hypothetical protein
MPIVKMADGTSVELPDNPSEELKTKIRAKNDEIKATMAQRPAEEPGLIGLQEGLGLPPEGRQPAQNWFSMGAGKPEMGLKEFGGEVAGGAVGGAVAGAAGPAALKMAGGALEKAPIPGAPGRIAKTVGAGMMAGGEAWAMLPAKERVLRGITGGAATEVVDALGEKYGLPKAATLPASLAAGGVAEAGASLLSKTSGQLFQVLGQAAHGNVSGAMYAMRGLSSPNKALNETTAKALQKQMFGEKTEGYIEGLVGQENRMAVQAKLRKEDPSLMQGMSKPGAAAAEGVATPVPGSGFKMSGERGMTAPASPAAAGDFPGSKLLTGPRALPAPGEAGSATATAAGAPFTAEGRKAADIKAALKAKAEMKGKAEAEAEALGLKPASQIYRERMFSGVTAAVNSGKTFSSTPEAMEFARKINTLVQSKELTPAQGRDLLAKISTDRSANPAVRDRFAQNVDNLIRKWGKPAETGGQTGAAAIDSELAGEVRGDLQKAYNGYTSRIGLSDIETKYRSAYSQEKLAEAKDKLPHFLAGFDSKEFPAFARNLARDPDSKPLIEKALATHLANVEPKVIVKEFEKLRKTLVDAKLVDPVDVKRLREAAEAVESAASDGLKMKRSERFQQLVLMAVARKTGGWAGERMASGQ